MPNTPAVVSRRYYPRLSSIVSQDDLPEILGFVKEGLQNLFEKLHYKDLQYSKSPSGDAAFYSLSIVSDRIDIELPGTGIFLVFNPDLTGSDFTISTFPITLEYQWKILKYLNSFNIGDFSYDPKEIFEVALNILDISEESALIHFVNAFVEPDNDTISPLQQFINDINSENSGWSTPIPQSATDITSIVNHIVVESGEFSSLIAFKTYLLKDDLKDTLEKVKSFFRAFLPSDINEYIKDILIPKFKVTLLLSAAIEFPRNILYPYKQNGSIWEREPENSGVMTRFYFGQMLLYADNQKGIGYNLDLIGDLTPQYSEIGNTGLLLQLQKLKIDISDKVNIPEADADGRPENFRGVYVDALSVTLPSKWFKTGANTNGSTLRIGGYQLLIGTGGLSGTFALEAVPTQNPSDGQIVDFFSSKFAFIYPIKGLINNTDTKEEEIVDINNETELLDYLNSLSNKNLYAFQFPLEISPTGQGNMVFNSQQEFRAYITGIIVEDNGTMWINIGSEENGFLVGFKRFDISFKQNKVVSSNLKGALEIKKFVYPEGAVDANNNPIAGQTVHIDIEGHLHDNGDFNLTASAEPPYPIEFPNVFTYHLKSIELGKEDDDYYIGTAGAIEFQGFLKETLKLDKIDIDRLRIYSDGSIELEGGSVQLVSPIVLKLGPVEITVSALHYGSHQREYDGIMRKFNYFGFDGGISVDPLGIEIRGDGVKFYYCVDEVEGYDKPDSYLHIQTIYLDLTIPSSTPVAIINGWLSIPEPGVSKEYAGGLKLQLPKVKITGSVDMKLMPKYPAFIVDASLEFPVPIPLGPIGIYGFRGLFGYRYVAEKEAIGLVSGVDTWYDYYKAPPRGIHVKKFNGPDKTTLSGTPISIGAGASLGTSADNGTILNIKAMVLISIPSLFMIDGRAAVLSARLGLDDTGEPPFFAFVAVGDNSLEFGFGADFKMPTKPSSFSIIKLYAEIQAGFFFKNQHPWYVNVGTKTNPITAVIVEILTIKSYVMLSAKGIQGGARGEFNFDKNYAGIRVYAHAYIEVGGKISFEKPQFSAYLAAGVAAGIDLWGIISFDIAIDILFGVEAPKPFLIYGTLYYSITIDLWIASITYSGNVELSWEYNSDVDRERINPMINPDNAGQIESLVRGVNMLSNEHFELAYVGDGPLQNTLYPSILEKIIPLDTYIDIKTEKGFLPAAIGNKIGGINNPPSRYTDLVPPDSSVQGHPIRQVTHQYSIESLEIKSWNPAGSGSWVNYNPYKAMYPTDPNPILNTLKAGQFQKEDGQYNTVRVLATTPFSYTEQGQPGWYIPEQYGITPTTLTCEAEQINHQCANFLTKLLGQQYFCYNPNEMFYSNNVSFLLYDRSGDDYAYITNLNNVHQKVKSLAFNNKNKLRMILPQPSLQVGLKLTCTAVSVKIKYYAPLIDDTQMLVQFGNPDPNAIDPSSPFEIIVNSTNLNAAVQYNHPTWKPVTMIEIEPMFAEVVSQQILTLTEQIELINHNNNLILLGLLEGEIQDTGYLEDQLHDLICNNDTGSPSSFINRYSKPDSLNYYYSKEFIEYDSSFIYSIGKTGDNGLITKIDTSGNIVWEKSYKLPSEEGKSLIFKRIIQLNNTEASIPAEHFFQYVVYATTGDKQYMLSFSFATGEVIWIKEVYWKDVDVLVHIEASKIDFSFYFTISDRNQIDTSTRPFIGKIDGTGNLVKGSILIIPEEEFIINAISADNQGIVVAGRYIEKDSRGTIIRLDHDLKIINSLHIIQPYTTIHDIEIIEDGHYLISGYNNREDSLFVARIRENGGTILHNFPETKNHGSVIQLNNDGFYLLETTDYNGILNQLDREFNLIWKKEIRLNEGTNGIRNFTFNKETEKITLNAYSQSTESLVVYTDKDLQSCLTVVLENKDLKRTDANVEFLGTDQKTAKTDLKEIGMDVEELFSEKTELCPSGNGCSGEEDEVICELYNQILSIYEECFIHPQQEGIDYKNIVPCARTIIELLYAFNQTNPNYNLLEILNAQIVLINEFISKPDYIHYPPAWNAVQFILNYLNEIGNCNCECNDETCIENEEACRAYNQILDIYQYLLSYQTTFPNELYSSNVNQVVNILENLPSYIFEIPELMAYYHQIKALETLGDEFAVIDEAFDGLLNWLMGYGNCNCGDKGKDITMLHEVCWMSQQDYIYNINIPSQAAISQDAQATIDGVNKFIQPIWRPDTNYLIRFILKDTVDGNSNTAPFAFNYGFTTAGPVGYFHTHDNATYGDITLKDGKIIEDANGIVRNADGSVITVTAQNFDTVFNTDDTNNPPQYPIVAHPEKYALTALRQYIDYNRSYPNADGNLLSAKPLFYDDDETTKITLFFSKAYATNFFRKWEAYNGVGPFDGMLKIVIKDPREDISITNPPALDTIDTTVEIAQTTQEWHLDENPQIPFVLSQYANLFGNGGCTGIIETIKPKSEYIIVTPKKLKPSKLYTAIVNNMYDVNHNGQLENTIVETVEVHKFVFQTSQYRNFKEQVTSYLINKNVEGVAAQMPALFNVTKNLHNDEIVAAYETIKGSNPIVTGSFLSQNMVDNLNNNYQHRYDRIFEGIFGLSPLDKPISTEFNLIRDSFNQVIAIIVKNPEPYNNPKIPYENVKDCLVVLNGIVEDTTYKVLLSKDYSQAIIMNDSMLIPEGNLKIRFKYKIWDGNNYVVPAELDVLNPMYTVVIEIPINN